MSASPTRHDEGEQPTHAADRIDDLDLRATVAQVLDRWPSRRSGGRGDP